MYKYLSELIATVCFIGYVPYAPGTVCSLIVALVIYFLPVIPLYIYLIFILFFFIVGLLFSQQVAIDSGVVDPSKVVVDELVGMMISLCFLPKSIFLYTIAVCIFRFFDIVKPFPINKTQDFLGGFGIMIDDVFAGVFTLIFMQVIKMLS